MASCRAMALMTVESMPMWSAATRSMWMACSATPRKKLPPPTTMPISQPSAWTSAISCGYFVDEDGVDAEAAAGGQGFSGELEEDSFVHSGLSVQGRAEIRRGVGRMWSVLAQRNDLRDEKRRLGEMTAFERGLAVELLTFQHGR